MCWGVGWYDGVTLCRYYRIPPATQQDYVLPSTSVVDCVRGNNNNNNSNKASLVFLHAALCWWA